MPGEKEADPRLVQSSLEDHHLFGFKILDRIVKYKTLMLFKSGGGGTQIQLNIGLQVPGDGSMKPEGIQGSRRLAPFSVPRSKIEVDL